MFLASLISAHKYLQDKTYKNSAWSKVSGLNVQEINHAEKVMLQLLDYRLFVKKDTYDQWILMLQTHLKMNPTVASSSAASIVHTVQRNIQHQQQQKSQNISLVRAQQSLPSPPLEDSCMPESPKKRKLDSSSSSWQDDDKISKKRR